MRGRGALLPLVLFSVSIKRLFCKISEGERAGGRGEGWVSGTKLDGALERRAGTGRFGWASRTNQGRGHAKNTACQEAGQDRVGGDQSSSPSCPFGGIALGPSPTPISISSPST